ncbi:hypothetical protein V8J38_08135 [Brevundimonas olei]|uniref:Prepilin-type N-terminal cleavage/methylation domain-containing protein n=1 Tax=Brevundimonas olei TaxID=657642 RepID=A0ABZ2I8L3_9CAUL
MRSLNAPLYNLTWLEFVITAIVLAALLAAAWRLHGPLRQRGVGTSYVSWLDERLTKLERAVCNKNQRP